MKISIITVCKDAEKTLEKAIQSVIDQSYQNVEYIIVDGQSSDRTIEIINQYQDKITKYVSEPDTGIYNAMNKGLNLVTGDFVYFLNSDDYLVDCKVVEDVVQFVHQHPDAEVVYGDLEVRHPNGQVNVFTPPPIDEIAEFMICGSMPHQATFAHVRLFQQFGYFDEQYKLAADKAWYLELLRHQKITWYRMARTIASYYNGGRGTIDFRASRNEFWDAQNNAKFYQTQEWYEKRIKKFQSIIIENEIQLRFYSTTQNDQLEEKQKKIQQLRSRLKEMRVKQKKMNEIQEKLQLTTAELEAIKASKFWKLRSLWVRFKRTLGLKAE